MADPHLTDPARTAPAIAHLRVPMAGARAAAERLSLPGPLRSAQAADHRALWLGPDQWLLIGDGFSEALAVAGGFLTDVSHGRAAVRIGGPRARELLAKGCSLDLHARVFRPGHCAQTSIARTSVLLHALGPDDGFDLYCARSYAQSLWHWLTEAAAEFGYRVM